MKNLLITICQEIGYKNPPNKSGITLEMLLDGSLSGNIVDYVRQKTGCAKQTVTNAIKSTFPDRHPIHDKSLVAFILGKWDLKKCCECKEVKDIGEYYFNSSKTSGLSDMCKICNRKARRETYAKNPQKELHLNNIRRRQRDTNQTPKWADLGKIEKFYHNRPLGMHVDHIYPLNSSWVCGLHVLENLQYLPPSENLSKSNKDLSSNGTGQCSFTA